jgi:uncharacterized NAD(P)/FAD-binding protein YdhS
MRRARIVIIGGGCSGTLLALQLMRHLEPSSCEIVMIERASELGRGVAYNVPSDRCKLNVPAHVMGAFPESPDGFLQWLLSHGHAVTADEFVSRDLFGRYLQDLLKKQAARFGTSWITIQDEACDLEFDPSLSTWSVLLKSGSQVTADTCVLALGNMPRSIFQGIPVEGIFRSPYHANSYSDIGQLKRLLVVGSGLTAVDCVLEAEGRGFRGEYTMLSRHRRLPLAHEDTQGVTSVPLEPALTNRLELLSLPLRSLVRLVSRESRRLGSSQPAITAIRPHLQDIWMRLSSGDKSRFMRLVRPLWEVHRHRIPKQHLHQLQELMRHNRLRLEGGTIKSAHYDATGVHALITSGKKVRQEHYDAAMLCTGPESDLSKISTPLVTNLLRRGILAAGKYKLGADLSRTSLSSDGISRLKLLGPIQRESLWEITAVRELRLEAQKIAREITETLGILPSATSATPLAARR